MMGNAPSPRLQPSDARRLPRAVPDKISDTSHTVYYTECVRLYRVSDRETLAHQHELHMSNRIEEAGKEPQRARVCLGGSWTNASACLCAVVAI